MYGIFYFFFALSFSRGVFFLGQQFSLKRPKVRKTDSSTIECLQRIPQGSLESCTLCTAVYGLR